MACDRSKHMGVERGDLRLASMILICGLALLFADKAMSSSTYDENNSVATGSAPSGYDSYDPVPPAGSGSRNSSGGYRPTTPGGGSGPSPETQLDVTLPGGGSGPSSEAENGPDVPNPDILSNRALTSGICDENALTLCDWCAPAGVSDHPIRLGDGAKMETVRDTFLSGLGGLNFWHRRTYSSEMNASTQHQGPKWFGGYADYFLKDDGSDIKVHIMANSTIKFTGAGLTPPDAVPFRLVHDATDKEYRFHNDVDGQILVFHDFSTSVAAVERGLLKERTQRDWTGTKSGWLYSYDSSGRMTLATAPTGQDYEVAMSYSGDDITSIVVKDGTTEVRRAEFIYRTSSHHADLGPLGSLVQAKTRSRDSAGTGWIERFTQYRYHSDGEMKAVFNPDAVTRIIADNSNITAAGDVLSKADTYATGGTEAVEDFASKSFEYFSAASSTSSVTTAWGSENLESKYGGGSTLDESGFVKSEVVRTAFATGCCGSGASGITLEYYYMDNAGHTAGNVNSVERIVIEDTLDASGTAVYRQVHGVNESGRLLRRALIEDPTASSPSYWCESWKLNDDQQVTEYRRPSAHDVDSEADLRTFFDGHSGVNDGQTLHNEDGLVHKYVYTDGVATGERVVLGEKSSTSGYVKARTYLGGTNLNRYFLVSSVYEYFPSLSSNPTNKTADYSYQAFWSGTDTRKIVKKTLQAIDSSQNGGDGATGTETYQYFDDVGRLRWEQDGEGYITYYSYHPEFGSLAYVARDVNPASMPSSATSSAYASKWLLTTDGQASSNVPTRDGNLPTPLAHVTRHEFDTQGRLSLTTSAAGVKTYTVYENGRTLQFRAWDSSTNKPLLPIQARVVDDSGVVLEEYTVDPARTNSSGGVPIGLSTGTTQSHYVGWTKYSYDGVTGNLTSVDRYHDIPSSGSGTLSTHYYRTAYGYDDMGRRDVTVQVVSGTSTSSSVEQVTQQIYDFLGRVVEVKRGVSSAAHNMTADYDVLPTTMQRMSLTEYDGGGVGDGHVTMSVTYYGTGATDNTGQIFHRNHRGQLRGIEPIYNYNPTTGSSSKRFPVTIQDVDWSGRVTTVSTYSAAPSYTWSYIVKWVDDYAEDVGTDRLTVSTTSYDDLGRVYRTESFSVDDDEGGTYLYDRLQTDRYYDRNSQLIAESRAHGGATEYAYDGLGRQYETRVVEDLEATKYSSAKFNYRAPLPDPYFGSGNTSAMSGGDDKVVEMTHLVHDDAGNVIESHTFEANHNDSDGLNLSSTTSYVRGSVYSWYDDADRTTTTADYGSGHNGGTWRYASMRARPTVAPTVSDSQKLVSATSYYADTGRLEISTDPKGKKTKYFYDDLGRTTYQVDSYVNFSPPSSQVSGPEHDLVVHRQYDGLGNLTELVALDRDGNGNVSDNEVTTYLREDSYNASLVTNTIYPDSSDTTSSGSDQVKTTFHLDGSLKTKQDQRGTVITYVYDDKIRKVKREEVTTLGTGTDSAVRSISYGYDSLWRKDLIQSFANTSGTGTPLSEISLEYDPLGELSKSYQSHQGAVNTSTTPAVAYRYDLSVAAGSRVYDDGRRLQEIEYPSGRQVNFDFGTANGRNDRLDRVDTMRTDIAQPTEFNWNDIGHYEYNGVARLQEVELTDAGVSSRLDESASGDGIYENVDRFGRLKEKNWIKTSQIDGFSYTYDYASNRTARDYYSGTSLDQTFTYDAAHRLKTFSENGSQQQSWTLDTWGNWATFVDGATTQTRTHNNANETLTISNWQNPVLDAAGNMTTVPQPASPSSGYTLKYDAWNRLVEVKDGSTVVASYEYDGLHRRIVSTIGADDFHYYYSAGWQVLEVRKNSSTDPLEQYVWHPHYVDALCARFWDGDANGNYAGTNEIHFATQDANFNVTALVDTAGTVIERYKYTPYGQVVVLDANLAVDADGKSDVANPVTYTGAVSTTRRGFTTTGTATTTRKWEGLCRGIRLGTTVVHGTSTNMLQVCP